tara:strand:+ start:874 stop:1047 length:174 start_codon:yes stop_codon:yes gene_type:complete
VIKLKDIISENKISKDLQEVDKKTLDKAGKLVTHLVKYYGLKVSSARNAVADLVRFL